MASYQRLAYFISRSIFWAVVGLLAIVAFLSLTSRVVEYFPVNIETALAHEILKGIVQVDGILIGLSGILYSQLIWSINSQQNVLYEKILEDKTEDQKNKASRIEGIKSLQKKRRLLIMALMVVTLFFWVLSCLL